MIITAGNSRFDVDAAVFDKDGTLIDLVASWSPAGRAWIATTSDGDETLAKELGEVIGVHDGEIVAEGLLAAGTMRQLCDATMSVLKRGGVADADRRIAAARGSAARITNENLIPIGDVAGSLARMVAGGMRIGVVTSDERASTLDALVRLGISDLVEVMVAGDDGWAPKPSPEPLLCAAATLGVDIGRVLYVGDSNVDRDAASAARVGAFVLVTSDEKHRSPSEPGVDAIIRSVDELVLLPG